MHLYSHDVDTEAASVVLVPDGDGVGNDGCDRQLGGFDGCMECLQCSQR